MKRRELTERRTANTKVFENQDHSMTAEIYLNPVHYQEEDGSWKEMNDTFAEEDVTTEESEDEPVNASIEGSGKTDKASGQKAAKEFVNKKGRLKIRLKNQAKEQGTVTISKDDVSLTWGLEGAGKGSKKASAQKTGDSEVTYCSVQEGVDIRCRVQGETVKEDIILADLQAPETFTFLYRLKKLKAVSEGRTVSFVNDQGEEVFQLAAPVMTDAAGAKSEAISIALEEEKKDCCRITFVPDAAWLKDPERKYPVIIDPATTTSKKRADIEDAHVDSLNSSDNFQYGMYLKTKGGDSVQRSFLKFKLPAISTGDMVVNASLFLASLAQSSTERTVEVHKVLQDWSSSTINWHNKPLYDEKTEDLCRYSAATVKKGILLDITRLVKDWYQNGKNYGLMLKDDYELSGYTEFLSSDCDDAYEKYRPCISISYVNYSGLEDFWTYHSQDVGRAGTAHVNDYNGNVIFIHKTLEMGGSRMPVSLDHVYNSNNRTANLGYGNGFCLSCHQTLKKVTIAGTDYYKHTDGDGTIHYFRYDETKKEWKDELGLELTLTINTGASEPYIIKDKEDNNLVFNSSGYLIKMRDKNSNVLSITYSSSRITKLTDGAGRVTTLTYLKDSSGNPTNLSQVTSPSGQVKKFAYTDNNLTSITDIDGEMITYTFTARNNLSTVTNVDGYAVKFSYYTLSPYRVKKITEYGGSTAGRSLTLTYGYNSTKFTDNKGRSEIYRFNNSGNLIHIHDGFGHAASGKYNRDGNHVNRLENETKLQDNIVQFLKDPIIQAKTIGWKGQVYKEGAGTASVNTDTGYCKIGTRSLKAESTALDNYTYWYQDVTLKKGETYTASMYVRAVLQETAENGGCFVRVRYMDKDGNAQRVTSEVLKSTTTGFVHLRTSFTLPADASSTSVRVYLMICYAIGTVYGDMAQLETGNTANRCNLIDNGEFHLGTTAGFSKTGRTEDKLTTIGASNENRILRGLMVTAASTVMYSTPAATGTKVATLSKGQHIAGTYAVTGSDGNGWYSVINSSNQKGYIPNSSAVPYIPGSNGLYQGVVAVTNPVLRATASDTGTPVQEWIPQGTSIVIITSAKDANGKKWYRVAFNIDTDRYCGYLPTDAVIRLCINAAGGKMSAEDKLFSTPSLTGTSVATLAKDKTVNLRGVLTKSDGEIWYAVLNGKKFVFLPARNLTITTEPDTGRLQYEKFTEKIGGLENHIFKFVGDHAVNKKLTKTLDLAGKKGDTYMVNAWGRGTPLPETDNDTARRFGVEVIFVGTDGTNDVHYTNFSPDILDWQFLSDVYVAKKEYSGIKVSYTYCHNANTAYFDGLSLFREEFGQTYTYDEDNNLISVTDAQKKATKFEYNSSSDLTGIVDARGNKFTYEYDSKHNVTKGTSAQGVVYRLQYDTAGNVIKSGCVDPSATDKGTWTERTMTTDKNHVSAVTDCRNSKVQYVWNANKDLLTSMTDARGSKVTYGYDSANRLTSVSQSVTRDGTAKTVKNTYAYTKDKLTKITHNGFSYGFAYDAFGNILNASIAGKQVVGYEYEAKNGNLLKVNYGNGDSIRHTYDSQDRLEYSYYTPASGTEQKTNRYVYDKQGNLARVYCYAAGKTYNLFYDLLGRLMRVRDESGNFYEYTYDANNNMTRLKHSADGTAIAAAYTYDKDGRETKATAGTTYYRTTAYDTLGRVSQQSWNTAAPFTIAYTYKDTSTTKRSTLPAAIKMGDRQLAYTYDANGNITKIVEKVTSGETTQSKTRTYQYDELNQLIRENDQVQNRTFVYDYDLGGNLAGMKEYGYTTAAEITKDPINTFTGTYDTSWKDKLLKWGDTSMTYDAIGNMLTKGTAKYTWSQGRKLSTVVKDGVTARYVYDHTGARVKKTVGSTVTQYRMAGDLLLSEKRGTEAPLLFRYDSAANLLCVTYKNRRYFYVRNAQNDIIALVDVDGKVVVEYIYDSWGKVIDTTGDMKDTLGKRNPFRYRGYYYDEETGMYYLKSRYYDPELRRFIGADDVHSLTSSLMDLTNKNLYIYCDNNPDVRKDPDGRFWVEAIVGAAVNVATTFIAAKVTGQEYGFLDAAAAAGAGFVNAVEGYGKILSGAVAGVYAGVTCYMNGAGIPESIFCGVVSGVCTTASISNLANLPEINLKIKVAATASADVVFGTGYNCMSAATYKAIDSRKEIKAAKKPDRSYYTTPRTNPAKVQSYETIYRNGGWVNVAF